jgi:hypothetical protein
MKQSGCFVCKAAMFSALTALCSFAHAADVKGTELFQKRVLPLLTENCFLCHGAAKMSGLDLRSREMMLKGGTRGAAVVPGSAEKSNLYRFVAGLDKIQMPPGKKLSEPRIADIKMWIDAGAPWAENPQFAIRNPQSNWAFQPVKRVAPPKIRAATVTKQQWAQNPIDAFILAKLQVKGLKPAPRADKITLIRRAYFDLIGLPPTPQEVQAFLNDKSPNAWEKLIDRLLASPRYGERWARHWLDLARYAESEGFKSDELRLNAWRYRDYVIKSFNEDKPYDRFIKEQIAGDELYPNDPNALVATGFNRHFADESNARNITLRRQEILNDITDTVGSTLLGLTIGCARCHDHKYDPISHKDYYRLQAFFAAVRVRDDIPLSTPEQRKQYEAQLHEWEEKTKDIRAELAALEKPYFQKLYLDKKDKFPAEIQDAIDTPPAQRTALQWILFRKVEPQIQVTSTEMGKAMKSEEQARWEELTKKLDEFKHLKPAPLPVAIGISDIGRDAPKTYVLKTGVYDATMEEVEPGVLSVLSSAGFQPVTDRMSVPQSTGRRTALAHWIASPDNPLTARVMVNRLWNYHFGHGIVATESDFGNAGEKPTHPELLDWLATEFVRRGWSLKQMHKLIMTSQTYQQSTLNPQPSTLKVDPDNKLLSRFPRRRLEGEVIRDVVLAVSGELNLKEGGPSVFPELPPGITTRGGWTPTADIEERNRRSIYVFVKRNLRYPMFEAFDMPDTHEPCARRQVTTTAPQALMLLNGELVLRSAQSFAGRLLKEAGTNSAAQVERAYRLAFSRPPDAAEKQKALAFLQRQAELIRKNNRAVLLPVPLPDPLDEATGAALVDFCHALLNANEFVYVE